MNRNRRHNTTIPTASDIAWQVTIAAAGTRGMTEGLAAGSQVYRIRFRVESGRVHLSTEGSEELRRFGARAMIAAMTKRGWVHTGEGWFATA